MFTKKIIVSVTNDLSTDQRVNKVCTTLTQMGFSVVLVGRLLKNSLPLENRKYKCRRLKLPFNKGVFFYASYNIYLFFFLLFNQCDVLLANDLDTLVANYFISKLKQKPLVYDSHEYFTEVPELVNRPFVKNIWTKIENHIVPKLKNCYTVNQSIATIYEQLYKTNFKVVRNVPYIKKNTFLMNITTPIKTHQHLIIYQGSVNIGRGLEAIINTMPLLFNCELWIIGDGDILEDLKKIVSDKKLNSQIVFCGKILFEQLAYYTQQADIGISIEEKLGKNYELALPNKLFDYIQAGIPVLASNLIEIKRIFSQFEIGCLIDNHTPTHIAEKVNFMLSDSSKIKSWKKNMNKAATQLCWEKEEKTIIELFYDLK